MNLEDVTEKYKNDFTTYEGGESKSSASSGSNTASLKRLKSLKKDSGQNSNSKISGQTPTES